MAKFLITEDNSDGYALEQILDEIRGEVLGRCQHITGDNRPEAELVLSNNIEILQLLTKSIHLAENSTKILNLSFGRKQSQSDEPRIGT
jgi:hypothetical protein